MSSIFVSRTVHSLLVALFLAAFIATSSLAAEPDKAAGRKIFMQICSGCHGTDGLGTDQGPALLGDRIVQRMHIGKLRNLIRTGVLAAGMPAFPLPADQLADVAAFVHSLNAPASESTFTGDPAPGERFFFGEGQCASCHMVNGRGKAVGPDLSAVGDERTAHEIETALLNPSAQLVPGYQVVDVKLRRGETIRGFARGRSNFDLRLQDFNGNFHLLEKSSILSMEEEKTSLMPPLKASPDTLHNLMVYLSHLTGVPPGRTIPAEAAAPSGITFARIEHPKPGDWLTYNGKLNGNRYSNLTQINRTTVSRLGVKWTFSVPLWEQFYPHTPYYIQNLETFGLETTPIVADGVMYITGPNSMYALDASNGREIWEYSRPRTEGIVGDASLGTNRGAAILGDKVFMATDNAHLLALNRTTGRVVWENVMPDEPQHYGSTIAPLVVKDMVIAGVSGGDWGLRGFIAAYKASTGERAWRHWTVPAKGEPGIETWKGPEPKLGGGATWLTGSYDPETDTLYWPTGNPWPDSDDRNRGGDNLYTNCILALNPDTGKMKWYYQFTPHDVHDWDATEPAVLVDTRYHGKERKLLLLANRNGFFYVLDRTNGELLLVKSFIDRLTWASGIGPDGRPQRLAEHGVSCPESATNWNATAFSPVTRLYYVMALEDCSVELGAATGKEKELADKPAQKYLRALDIETGKRVWEIPQIGPAEGKRVTGVLATAGGLIFYGDPSGDFVAVDERNGKPLWHFPANETHKTSPMTYMVNGKQYVAIAAGSHVTAFALP